jgi:hypothetical protein
MISIEQLEKEVNLKTEMLNLLKSNKTINNFTLGDFSIYISKHQRTKIEYVHLILNKSTRLRKRVKILVSTQEDFDVETFEGREIIKNRILKYWKFYIKKYYPEYINLITNQND